MSIDVFDEDRWRKMCALEIAIGTKRKVVAFTEASLKKAQQQLADLEKELELVRGGQKELF